MKPSQNIRTGAQKFPLVDYHYHAAMLNGSSAPSEAAVFTALIVMAIMPIVTGISAVLQLLSTLSLF